MPAVSRGRHRRPRRVPGLARVASPALVGAVATALVVVGAAGPAPRPAEPERAAGDGTGSTGGATVTPGSRGRPSSGAADGDPRAQETTTGGPGATSAAPVDRVAARAGRPGSTGADQPVIRSLARQTAPAAQPAAQPTAEPSGPAEPSDPPLLPLPGLPVAPTATPTLPLPPTALPSMPPL